MDNSPHAGLSLSGVCERDIDLLLLEEFLSTPDFLAWFVAQTTGITSSVRLLSADRSVTQSNGESDLEVSIEAEGSHGVRLLIENKVNASLQPQQAERYRSRGESHRLQGKCHEFKTILVAPARYFGSKRDLKGFDATITYEEIKEWFTGSSRLGDRVHYKTALLTAAIQKGELGYQVIENDFVSDFWMQYWQMAREMAPELNMPKPTPKPSGATFIAFKPNGLPKGVEIWHKLSHGNVDLQFAGYGDRLHEIEKAFGMMIEPGMEVVKAAKSGALRVKVPVVNVANSFDEQEKGVRLGLHMAQHLLNWCLIAKDFWPPKPKR